MAPFSSTQKAITVLLVVSLTGGVLPTVWAAPPAPVAHANIQAPVTAQAPAAPITKMVLGFAFTFGILFSLWKAQFTFFRRYGLEDETTINLTGVFLFLVMFSVYPLKFLLGSLADLAFAPEGTPSPFGSMANMAWLFFAYGIGFSAIFATLAALYGHAYRRREKLSLTELEVFETVQSIRRYLFRSLSSVLLLACPLIFSTPQETRDTIATPAFMVTVIAVYLAARWDRRRARARRDELAAAQLARQEAPALA